MRLTYYKGKKIFITGAGKGIGRSMAMHFAAEGAHVFVSDVDEEHCRSVVDEIKASGQQASAHPFDITDIARVREVADMVLKDFQKIDILINNVGIGLAKNMMQTTEQDFDRVFHTNLKGPFFLTQKFVTTMEEGDSILFLSSIHEHRPSMDPTYDGSKSCISNWVKNFAIEFASRGIRVNGIAPGHIDNHTQDVPRAQRDVPLYGRAGLPSDIARAALFLCDTTIARYITGEVLEVSGGLSLWEQSLRERRS